MSENTTPSPRVYFYKEIWSSRVIISGKAVDFERLDGDRGVLALTPGRDDTLIAGLNACASRQVGGVVKISAADYDAKKNQFPYRASGQPGREMLRVVPLHPSPIASKPIGAAAIDPKATAPTPMEAPPLSKLPDREVAPLAPAPPAPAVGPGNPANVRPATRKVGLRPSEVLAAGVAR